MEQRSLIQLRDLDCVTTKEDVLEAILREIGMTPDDVKVLTIRHVFAGEQTAVVLIPRQAASKLLDKGRVRVGLVYYRVREAPRLTHCYRCQEEGHKFRNCKGVDRSKDCRRCGNPGHFAKDCGARPQEAETYRRSIQRSKEAITGASLSSL